MANFNEGLRQQEIAALTKVVESRIHKADTTRISLDKAVEHITEKIKDAFDYGLFTMEKLWFPSLDRSNIQQAADIEKLDKLLAMLPGKAPIVGVLATASKTDPLNVALIKKQVLEKIATAVTEELAALAAKLGVPSDAYVRGFGMEQVAEPTAEVSGVQKGAHASTAVATKVLPVTATVIAPQTQPVGDGNRTAIQSSSKDHAQTSSGQRGSQQRPVTRQTRGNATTAVKDEWASKASANRKKANGDDGKVLIPTEETLNQPEPTIAPQAISARTRSALQNPVLDRATENAAKQPDSPRRPDTRQTRANARTAEKDEGAGKADVGANQAKRNAASAAKPPPKAKTAPREKTDPDVNE